MTTVNAPNGLGPWDKPEVFDDWDLEARIEDLEEENNLNEEYNALFKLKTENEKATIFVRDDFFEQHVQEMAMEDLYLGEIEISTWPLSHINWPTAIEDFKNLWKYKEVSINGTKYWVA